MSIKLLFLLLLTPMLVLQSSVACCCAGKVEGPCCPGATAPGQPMGKGCCSGNAPQETPETVDTCACIHEHLQFVAAPEQLPGVTGLLAVVAEENETVHVAETETLCGQVASDFKPPGVPQYLRHCVWRI